MEGNVPLLASIPKENQLLGHQTSCFVCSYKTEGRVLVELLQTGGFHAWFDGNDNFISVFFPHSCLDQSRNGILPVWEVDLGEMGMH